MLERATPLLRKAGLATTPLAIASQARAALGDEIGEAMGATVIAVLIGERPGLTATDSLGIYLTFAPRRGRTAAERNCISNIREGGMDAQDTAEALPWLAGAVLRLGATSVTLRDEQPATPLIAS